MRNVRRAEWHAHFDRLPQHIRALAEKSFTRFCNNAGHPSLRVRKMRSRHRGHECIEATISMDYRAVAYIDGSTYVWFWIGTHNAFDSRF